jgi:sec-independent protein translocase protein TatC
MANNDRELPLEGLMPFLDHLEELRRRLFYCAIAIAVGGLVAFAVFSIPGFDPIGYLTSPATRYLHGAKLVYLHPGEAFQTMLDVGFAIALVVASPVIGYQLWGFVAPAMYAKEKRIALPVVMGVVVLFVTGVVLAFTLILPLTLRFLLGVEANATPMITLSEYMGFAIYMCMAFGAAFELPIVLMGLTAIGIVTPAFLAKWRRYALVGVLIAATFITPDPTSMFVIALPLYGLYELSIWLSRMVFRWRERRENENNDDDEPPPDGPQRTEPLRLSAPL